MNGQKQPGKRFWSFLLPSKREGDTPAVHIPLTKGKHALVSAEDAPWVKQLKWRVDSGGQVYRTRQRNGIKRYILLHRLIYERMHQVTLTEREEIGFRDGNILNNQRHNLERRTWSERSQRKKLLRNNTSGYRGVSWHKRHARKSAWRAAIRVQGKLKWLGYYSSPEEAARAYNEAAIHYFGPKAKVNKV